MQTEKQATLSQHGKIDIDVLQSIHQALSPLSSLTDILSGEKSVTVSAILPMINLIDNKFLQETEQDTELTKHIKQEVQADLHTRYTDGDVLELLQVASYLDPWFKMKYLTEAEAAAVKEKLELERECLIIDEVQTETPEPVEQVQKSQPPAKKPNLGTLFKDNEESEEIMDAISREQRFQTELNSYSCIPRLDFEEDPLAWWSIHSSSYLILSQLAKKYLCVCATSCSSERLFSASGNIVSPLRATLNPDKVDMLTFLAKNL